MNRRRKGRTPAGNQEGQNEEETKNKNETEKTAEGENNLVCRWILRSRPPHREKKRKQ